MKRGKERIIILNPSKIFIRGLIPVGSLEEKWEEKQTELLRVGGGWTLEYYDPLGVCIDGKLYSSLAISKDSLPDNCRVEVIIHKG